MQPAHGYIIYGWIGDLRGLESDVPTKDLSIKTAGE